MHPNLRKLKRAIAMVDEIENAFDDAGFKIDDADDFVDPEASGYEISHTLFVSTALTVKYNWNDYSAAQNRYEGIIVSVQVSTWEPGADLNHFFLRLAGKKSNVELMRFDVLNSETKALLAKVYPDRAALKEGEPHPVPPDKAEQILRKIVAYVARRKAELEKAAAGAA